MNKTCLKRIILPIVLVEKNKKHTNLSSILSLSKMKKLKINQILSLALLFSFSIFFTNFHHYSPLLSDKIELIDIEESSDSNETENESKDEKTETDLLSIMEETALSLNAKSQKTDSYLDLNYQVDLVNLTPPPEQI